MFLQTSGGGESEHSSCLCSVLLSQLFEDKAIFRVHIKESCGTLLRRFFKRDLWKVLRMVLRRDLAVEFSRRRGSAKGSWKEFSEGRL